MICNKCGNPVTSNAKFCNVCGNRIYENADNLNQQQFEGPLPNSNQQQFEGPVQNNIPPQYAAPAQNNFTPPQYAAPVQNNIPPQYAGSAPYNNPAQFGTPVPQGSGNNKKSNTGLIIAIVVLLIAIAGVVIFLISSGGDNDEPTTVEPTATVAPTERYTEPEKTTDAPTTGTTAPVTQPPSTTVAPITDKPASAEYTSLLSQYGIPDRGNPFTGLSFQAFAKGYSGVSLDVTEYGYTGDIVKEIKVSTYIRLDSIDYTADSLESYMLTEMKNMYGSLSFATFTTDVTDTYVVVTAHLSNINNRDNLNAMINAGLINSSSSFVTYLSMSQSVSLFITNGFVQR